MNIRGCGFSTVRQITMMRTAARARLHCERKRWMHPRFLHLRNRFLELRSAHWNQHVHHLTYTCAELPRYRVNTNVKIIVSHGFAKRIQVSFRRSQTISVNEGTVWSESRLATIWWLILSRSYIAYGRYCITMVELSINWTINVFVFSKIGLGLWYVIDFWTIVRLKLLSIQIFN